MKPVSTLSPKQIATVLGVVVSAVVIGKCVLQKTFTSGEVHAGRERVRLVLEGLKPGGNQQQSICLWAEGTRTLPGGMERFSAAMDAFDVWAKQKGISPGRLSDFEILEAQLVKGGEQLGTGVVLVKARIDGQACALRVTPGAPIEWVD
jgi:hypothetical protein